MIDISFNMLDNNYMETNIVEKAEYIFKILCNQNTELNIEELAEEFRKYSAYDNVKEHFGNIEIENIPICLIKNGSINNIMSTIYRTQNGNRIINIIEKHYTNDKTDDKFNIEYVKILETIFIHGYDIFYSEYYLNKIKCIYYSNINNSVIAIIYTRCLEYGFFKTSKFIFYRNELNDVYERHNNDSTIVDYYVKSLDILVKQNENINILDRNVKKMADIYSNHKNISVYYSNALLKILFNEKNAEIKYDILSKLQNICNENKSNASVSWNYAKGYLDCISYDLEIYQKEEYLLNDYSSNKIYKTTKISFPRNHLVIDYDEEFDDDEGSSFHEALEIYIFKPNDIIKINEQLKSKEIGKINPTELIDKDRTFYSKLTNNNVKDLFLYLHGIYVSKKENKCPFDFINLINDIEYIFARWSR
jgi:hypothetical protein